MLNKHLATGIAIAAFALPLVSFAQTTDSQSQINALLAQIKTLQTQLMQLVASSTMSQHDDHQVNNNNGNATTTSPIPECAPFLRNLHVGQQGDDVRLLQQILRSEDGAQFNSEATGFFGSLTAKALANLQLRFGIATSTDGTFGQLTREFFKRRCEGGQNELSTGIIYGTITANATSSVTVKTFVLQTRTIKLTASTTISVLANATSSPRVGSIADLTTGKVISAEVWWDRSGTITARSIKVGLRSTQQDDNKDQQGNIEQQDNSVTNAVLNALKLKDWKSPSDGATTSQLWAKYLNAQNDQSGQKDQLPLIPLPPQQNQNGQTNPGKKPVSNGGQGQSGNNTGQGQNSGQQGPGPVGAMLVKGGVMVAGTVSAVSTSSITVQSDGGTKTFAVSANTKVSIFTQTGQEPTSGSIANVTTGSKVRVIGMTNDNGVVTASMIQTGTLPPVNF